MQRNYRLKYKKEFKTLSREDFVSSLQKTGMKRHSALTIWRRYNSRFQTSESPETRIYWLTKLKEKSPKRTTKPNEAKIGMANHLISIKGLNFKNLYRFGFTYGEYLWLKKEGMIK